MDLLTSLGLQNDLPEQSTRLSHPGVVAALDRNGDVRLGFNSCCACGIDLHIPEESEAKVKHYSSENGAVKESKVLSCKGCNRVRYCSIACMKADAEPTDQSHSDKSGVEEDIACGHSPLICSLLQLCNDDDDAEEELFGKNQCEKNQKTVVGRSKKAAEYRIKTEMESYPATLFNVLVETPHWFIDAMTKRLRSMESPIKIRREKRDRDSYCHTHSGHGKKELVLHIVGASVDSELWGWDGRDETMDEVMEAYGEASTNLLSFMKSFPISLHSIRLVFFGPDCPQIGTDKRCFVEVPIPDSKATLAVETHCCYYGEKGTQEVAAMSSLEPDAIIFFNPGFSCPDYDWSNALSTASSYNGEKPFLVTTNTEMEGFADIKILLDAGYINRRSLPSEVLVAVDDDEDRKPPCNDEADGCTFFLNENPYAGLRIRQSGTMANDLYVKNRWILGGVFNGGGNKCNNTKSKRSFLEEDDDSDRRKKKGRKGNDACTTNTKKENPALI